jgi:tRNA(fMet)-specific endonuclease VapC
MSVYLLDTDTLTLIQYGHATVVNRLSTHPDSAIVLSVISIQEQMKGWLARLRRLRLPQETADWYYRLIIEWFPVWRRFVNVSFSVPAIQRFDLLRNSGLRVGPMDLRIAATALEHGLIVVTRNARDFGRVPGLAIEDWSV